MKKTTKLAVAAISVAVTIGLAGAGLSSAHDRWQGSKGYHAAQGHGGQGQYGGRHGKGHKMMGRMMEQFDTNGDGLLTQAEIDAGRQQQLAKYDSDKDGNLSLEEFQVLWMEMNRSRMVDHFQRLDEDGDASVTAGEFLDPFADVVARRDRNGDGALSKDDRRKKGWRGDQGQGRQGNRAQ